MFGLSKSKDAKGDEVKFGGARSSAPTPESWTRRDEEVDLPARAESAQHAIPLDVDDGIRDPNLTARAQLEIKLALESIDRGTVDNGERSNRVQDLIEVKKERRRDKNQGLESARSRIDPKKSSDSQHPTLPEPTLPSPSSSDADSDTSDSSSISGASTPSATSNALSAHSDKKDDAPLSADPESDHQAKQTTSNEITSPPTPWLTRAFEDLPFGPVVPAVGVPATRHTYKANT
jgi:hypothetical protein